MNDQERLIATAALIEECYGEFATITEKFIGRLCVAELVGIIECLKSDLLSNSNFADVSEVSH